MRYLHVALNNVPPDGGVVQVGVHHREYLHRNIDISVAQMYFDIMSQP
jgi:hypothetical protein